MNKIVLIHPIYMNPSKFNSICIELTKIYSIFVESIKIKSILWMTECMTYKNSLNLNEIQPFYVASTKIHLNQYAKI